MGGVSSHPLPPKPVIDNRLFHTFSLLKTKTNTKNNRQNQYGISITPTVPSSDSKVYNAVLNQEGMLDVEIFDTANPGRVIGFVKFVDENGGDGKRCEIGVRAKEGEMISWRLQRSSPNSKMVEFTLPIALLDSEGEEAKRFFSWEITSTGMKGVIKEMYLRVKIEREDGWRQHSGVDETQEEGEDGKGEIVGVWRRKRTWFFGGSGNGIIWVKCSFGKLMGEGVWEGIVLGSGLGILEGVERL